MSLLLFGGTAKRWIFGRGARVVFKLEPPIYGVLTSYNFVYPSTFYKYSLYASCCWEDKAIRKLIGDGKLAARLKGCDDAADLTCHECPICFFNYSEINITKCCHALVCTECYLQIKPQKASSKNKQGKIQHNCPFCNAARLQVSPAPPETEGVGSGTMSEQSLSLNQTKIQQRTSGSNDGTTTPPLSEQSPPKPCSTPPTSGFGSHLEMNERVAMMRARSSSMSESQSSNMQSPVQEISNLAMTPEERRALEMEVRAQHNHPLTMRLEQEEAERRMRNEIEYYQRNASNNRRTIADVRRQAATRGQHLPPLPPRGAREWSRIVDALEHQRTGSNNNNGAVDDLVVLEAAMMMSIDDQTRRQGEPSSSSTGFNLALDRHALIRARMAAAAHQAALSEDQQIAMAIAASLREASSNTSNASSNNDNQENNANGGGGGNDDDSDA